MGTRLTRSGHSAALRYIVLRREEGWPTPDQSFGVGLERSWDGRVSFVWTHAQALRGRRRKRCVG
eukprot:2897152-Prymnesium_polylepis.1